MRQDALQALLEEFAAERIALLERHEAGARVVAHYDFNNAYQYVIAREETQVSWLQSALDELGASMPPPAAALPVPPVPTSRRRADGTAFRDILADDARLLNAFVERWRRRLGRVEHARHRIMLDVIVGESLEHARLFEQAAAGFEDVIGRRTPDAARVGAVLPVRWME